MSNQTNQASPIVAVSAVLDQILTTGQIAQQDAQWLLQAGMTLETELTPEEEAKLRVIFYRLGLGVLKVMY
jgi:hypothetical protein